MTDRSSYRGPAAAKWFSLALVIAVHALLIALLLTYRVSLPRTIAERLTVVDIEELTPSPPPQPPREKADPEKPVEPVHSPIIAPSPLVPNLAPPPMVVAAEQPVPPPPVEAPVPPRPPSIVEAGNLGLTMLSAPPPGYPTEARRKREQGTVVLQVLVGTDGRVSEITVRRSSGYARLDEAALKAVRRWRWSPKLVDGVPVKVRGLVEIPFVLRE